MKEKWKGIPWKPSYQVSTYGRVRSLDRIIEYPDGRKPYYKRGRILKQGIASNGYYTVAINGKSHTVHSLVLETFVGPCPEGMEARHFPDQSRTNNRIDNLAWASKSTNEMDKVKNGTDNRGSKHGRALLDESIVKQLRSDFIKFKGSQAEFSRIKRSQFGVSDSTVIKAIKGERWRYV